MYSETLQSRHASVIPQNNINETISCVRLLESALLLYCCLL